MNFSSIKNIIFDLGGVIINIDYALSTDALKAYSKTADQVDFSQKAQSELFDLYERGDITCAEFRDGLRREYDIEATDEQIDMAWNTMLLDIPAERIELLRSLKKHYKLFLLSNTNAIHMKAFNQTVQDCFGMPSLDSLFDKPYYSHLVRRRKPGAEVFEQILAENGLQAEETLFIDDSIQHIEGAKMVGLQTLHLAPPLTINQALKDALPAQDA
ncbi:MULTISPECIES: HAD family hydrolase [Rufibacter]|uniref:Putative hydrolase of the HAD superfamily n=1 Tax=Rufibacter quisquiliarum TaxID=1549639 RepID=A0A839GRQ9_9BACT|nr:HAD family phosphatase [Rufibacter ruber]MBA9077526.1 putative hydrolase of the HAD superfamily [Rufibacter quisquiliarum]